MFESLIHFIRDQYHTDGLIPLHAPIFSGQEKKFIEDAIDSTYVSSVGPYVDKFESEIVRYTGNLSKGIATVNGTSALHLALLLAGVGKGDLVITQALTFVATCNAISYCGADPIFVDVDRHTLGMSPLSLENWLEDNARICDDGLCRLKHGVQIIRACLPMHTFGHPVDLSSILDICKRWNLPLVEDAAESLGSLYRGQHTGTFGEFGTLSFNGNKIITTGGGGMLLTRDKFAKLAKHLSTTAKNPHSYFYSHDLIGYNYRLPNLNAALGCAQLEDIEYFVNSKRNLALRYESFFKGADVEFFIEPPYCRSNYWLNAVICEDKSQRDLLLDETNMAGVMTRPAWELMSNLPMYDSCIRGDLSISEWLQERIVNLPSSVLPEGGR